MRNAANLSLTMAHIARLIKNGGGVFVEYLVACACEEQSCNLMRRIAKHPNADVVTVRLMLDGLPARADGMGGLRRSIQAECCQFLIPLLAETQGLAGTAVIPVFFKWHEGMEILLPRRKYDAQLAKIKRMLEGHPQAYDLADTVKRSSDIYVQWIRECELPWPQHKQLPDRVANPELAAWPAQLNMKFLEAGDPDEVTDAQIEEARAKLKDVVNPLGRKVVTLGSLDSKSMHRVALDNETQVEGTRLFLASCTYTRQQERLPDKLEDLIDTKIVVKLPLDPYSLKAFQYSRDQRALWSVGPEGNVSLGAPKDEDDDRDRYLWRLDGLVP
jgi:hypothetical protein